MEGESARMGSPFWHRSKVAIMPVFLLFPLSFLQKQSSFAVYYNDFTNDQSCTLMNMADNAIYLLCWAFCGQLLGSSLNRC